MSRDKIYAGEGTPEGPFEFSEAVARVFPDMLRRSVPGYAATIQTIRSLAGRYAQPGTKLYDLGCSLGAATQAMRQGLTVPNCRIVAVDNAPAMVAKCRALTDEDSDDTPVDVVCADINDVPIENASVVVMNYTLQFVPPDRRGELVQRVAEGLRPGGIFLLSEKVVHPDSNIESALSALHVEFKRRHHYSDLEISRKRAALENVLVPESIEVHTRRMENAGFSHAGVWLQYFNFVSMLAIR